MKDDILKGIPKANKIDFLNKLNSGQFTLTETYKPQPSLTFDLLENGKYKCKQTGKVMSKGQIEALPGYKMTLELVGTREQVANEKPPSGIVLIPYSQDEYLASMLKSKFAEHISFDPEDPNKPFKSEKRSYSFEDLMRINRESPQIEFYMNESTKLKYIEALEKWC